MSMSNRIDIVHSLPKLFSVKIGIVKGITAAKL